MSVAGGFLEFERFGGVHQVIGREVGYLQSRGERVVDLQFAGFGAAGLDDDDAVGGTGAVDGRCRGVFEYGDALYAVHVEVVDLLDIDFKPVENEYRQTGFGAQVALGDVGKTVLTAYVDLRRHEVGVRPEELARVDYLERGVKYFQGVEETCVVDGAQLFALDLHGGTREAVLGFGGIPGHDDVVELVHIGFEVNAEERFRADGDSLCLVTDERDGEVLFAGCRREGEAAFGVGEGGARSFALVSIYGDSRQGLSVLVEHETDEAVVRGFTGSDDECVVDDAV